MTRKISPYWALLAGLVIVPLASATGALLVVPALNYSFPEISLPLPLFLACCVLTFQVSAPLGLVTGALIACWNAGHTASVRLACGILTVGSYIFWGIYYSWISRLKAGDGGSDEALACTLLFLSLLWTLLFPIFVLCAYGPKEKKEQLAKSNIR